MTVTYLPPGRRDPTTAFVMGGGGNLGAVQVGMLRAVLERGIEPDVIIGCSVGAINGAALAAEPTLNGARRIASMWLDLDGEALCPSGRLSTIKLLSRKTTAMASNDGLRELLERGVSYTRFEEARIPLHVVATSMATGRARWFSSGPLVEPILASAALPAVFPPVQIDGEWFIDGGVVDNVPVRKALELGVTRLVIFHVGNFDKPRPHPRRPIDVLLQSFSIARSHRWLEDIAHIPDDVEVITLPGIDPGNVRYNDFKRSRQLMERGYAASAAFLDDRLKVAAV